ncbi:MAG TPA: hypothetical protein VGE35_01615 [Candidatus Paceibacterota bacterium]
MSLFSSKPELGIVFHVGSSSVSAGLMRLRRGKTPQVLHVAREDIPYRDQAQPERFLGDMLDALKKVNANLARFGFGEYETRRIFYTFSSPWAVTQTKVAVVAKPEGFTLTKKLVSSIVAEQEKLFEKEMLGSNNLADKLHVLEKRVVQIKVNGEEVANPYGKKAVLAEISLFISLMPRAVIDRVFDVSMSAYHPKQMGAYSFPLASFSAIRDVFHDQRDFAIIDVGSELSDISVIKDGLILETASFPLGRHFLARKMARAFLMTPDEAASLVRLYHQGHAEAALEAQLQPVIAQASIEWSAALKKTLASVSQKKAPSQIFAIIDNDFSDFFMKAITMDTNSKVTLLNFDSLRSAVEFSKTSIRDPFIAVLAAFVGRVYETKAK